MVSRSRFPTFELVLFLLAVSVGVAIALAPSSAYLDPFYRPAMLWICTGWALWRALVFDRCLDEYQAWHQSPPWMLDPAALPGWLRRQLGTTQAADGIFLGLGFRWEASHVQALELELLATGALPVGPPPRGGFPGLHAVGRRRERPIILPWTEMPGQGGLVGTNRSGKTRELELIITQVIAHA